MPDRSRELPPVGEKDKHFEATLAAPLWALVTVVILTTLVIVAWSLNAAGVL